jgi:hypothetical protein
MSVEAGIGFLIANLMITFLNIALLALNYKLYTEHFKEVVNRNRGRSDKHERSGHHTE